MSATAEFSQTQQDPALVMTGNTQSTTPVVPPTDQPTNRPIATARRFRMDLRPYYSFWYKPSIPEIHQAIDLVFPEENPIMEEGHSNYLMSFTIHLNKEISVEPALFARFRRPVCYKVSLDEFIDVPLQPLREYVPRGGNSKGNRSDGILLTLLNAALISRETPNEAFDEAFSKLGEVTKPCELQKDLQYRRLNGNRYLVVKFNEGVRIPDTITVADPNKREMQYRVRYANKSWQCTKNIRRRI